MIKSFLICGLKDITAEEKNVLIRHTKKTQQHGGGQLGRSQIGGTHEFDTLIINPKYERTRNDGCFNIYIFDDYMNYGNGFNVIRRLFEFVGEIRLYLYLWEYLGKLFTEKIIILRGMYIPQVTIIILIKENVLTNFKINNGSNNDMETLYEVYNNRI